MTLAEEISMPKSIGNVIHLEECITCTASQKKKGKYTTMGIPSTKHVILLSLDESKDSGASGESEMPVLVAQIPPVSGWLTPPLTPNEAYLASLKEEASKPACWSNYSNLLVKVTPNWKDDTVFLGDDEDSLFGDYNGTSSIQDLIQDDDGYVPHLITLSSTNSHHTACILTETDLGNISKYLCTCPSIAACKCKSHIEFPF
jgi:hypothetical protein